MANFEMVPVSSSQIESIGYDEDTQQLRIAFINKRGGAPSLYEYDNVSPQLHEQLMTAPSIGSFFAATIKGVNPYRKIS